MNHTELHQAISDTIKRVKSGTIEHQKAKLILNGCTQLISNCRNELVAIKLGAEIDVPLLGLKKADIRNRKKLIVKRIIVDEQKKLK